MSESFDPYYKWLGIRPEHQPPSYYRLLGVSDFEDSCEVIENAADRQMTHVRSYATGKHVEDSQKLLNEIAAAKICLLDPARKADYDAQLRTSLAAAEGNGGGQRQVRPSLRRDAGPQAGTRPQQPAIPAAVPLIAADTSNTGYRRQRQPKWLLPALLGGGGVLLVLVVVLAAATSGDSQRAVDNPRRPPPARAPVATLPPQRPDPLDPPDTAPVAAPPVAAVLPGRPAQSLPLDESPKYALRFAAGQRVELQDTAAIFAPNEDFTIEVWVRPADYDAPQTLVGNFAKGGIHPDLPRGIYGGCLLWTGKSADKYLFGFATYEESGRGRLIFGQHRGPPTGRWVHLAATYSRGKLELFENGRIAFNHFGLPAPRATPSDLFLANSPFDNMGAGFAGDVGGLRISRGVRYRAPGFEPPRRFTADDDTLLVLDFDDNGGGGDTIRDVSGHGHHGSITGARWIVIDPKAELLGPASVGIGTWIDALELVDLSKHGVVGEWKRQRMEISLPNPEKDHCQFMIPVSLEGSYQLHFKFTRLRGTNIHAHLPVAGRECTLIIAGWVNTVSGLNLIDGKKVTENPTERPSGIVDGRRYAVDVDVAVEGEDADIRVLLDGQPYISWSGRVASLRVHSSLQIPAPQAIGLGSMYDTSVVFHEARLRIPSPEAAPAENER